MRNKIEQAIKLIEAAIKDAKGFTADLRSRRITMQEVDENRHWRDITHEAADRRQTEVDAYITALSVLRDRLEQENGCDWCTPEPGETLELRCWRHGCTKRAAYTTAGSVEGVPVFCPMCGKKMEESK